MSILDWQWDFGAIEYADINWRSREV
jgi:hypothetical protein